MDGSVEQSLLIKIRMLTPQQLAEVLDFVEFLASKSAREAAFDRFLAVAPAARAAGAEPISEEEIAAEIKAAHVDRHAGLISSQSCNL